MLYAEIDISQTPDSSLQYDIGKSTKAERLFKKKLCCLDKGHRRRREMQDLLALRGNVYRV